MNAISGIADLLSTKKMREGERLHTSVSNRPPLPITVFPTVYYLEEAPLTSLRPSGGADDATQPQACTAASEPNRSANDEDNSAEARDARAKAERQSIAKLLIISQSVGAIFCPLPGRNSVEEYLKNLDAAKPASATALAAGRSSLRSRGEPHDRQAEAKEATFPLDLVAERVLVEQKADHQFCIHVRDMEQLVPPAHLLPIPPSSSSAPVNSKSTTTRAKKSADASKTAATPPPDPVPLDPVARLKAMHKWRFDALKQSQWSLARYAVPNNVHAITRLRLHEPAKVDVTVVQSCGAPKRPEDILAALNRFTKGQQEENKSPKAERGSGSGTMGKEEEEVMKAIFLAAFTQQSGPERHEAIQSIAAMGMLSPFVVKPLITVYASCLPRREALIGKPVGEQEFLEQGENNLVERWLNVVSRSVEELEHHLMMEDGGELKQQLAKAKAAMLSGKKSRVNSASHLSSAKESQVSNIQQLELLTAAATQNFSSRMEVGGEEGYYAHCYKRPIPTMPRHTTRLTLMAEHNDLEGSDLISLAERITTRKKQQQQERSGQSVAADAVQTSRLKTTPRIYCLIKDGDRL